MKNSTSFRIGVVFVALGIVTLMLAALQAAEVISIFSASPVITAIVLAGIGLLMIYTARRSDKAADEPDGNGRE